ncbi:MAG: hypothetical protein HYW49_00015 [Deltaproteobacteria bacterium]|nr:hypothetical protein [Deltaproteobacteria bacterium]
MEKTKKYEAHVRFSEEELERITTEAKETGWGVPDLLRRAYARKKPLRILMPREEACKCLKLLFETCNALNQINRSIAAGAVTGIDVKVAELYRTHNAIIALMSAHAFAR